MSWRGPKSGWQHGDQRRPGPLRAKSKAFLRLGTGGGEGCAGELLCAVVWALSEVQAQLPGVLKFKV